MADDNAPESAPEPVIPASEEPPELSIRALGLGALFGIIFGAANAYLGLVAGLTVSTSIPVAVMTVGAFRLIGRGSTTTLLEANTAQTTGSASSSVASGVIFTLPALFLWGAPPSVLQMTMLAVCGGLLGVLFMIPLRRFLIVAEHKNLPYPEGTACAEVLKASQAKDGGGARAVFVGLGVGALMKVVLGWLKAIPGKFEVSIPVLPKALIGTKVSAALVGVGYILGPRIGFIMVGGGLLSSLVIIPVIAAWGADKPLPLYPEAVLPIAEMSASDIWNRYVRYIGAGAVATGGIITLIRSAKTMVASVRIGIEQLKNRVGHAASIKRTDDDLSLRVVGIGALLVFLLLALVPIALAALPGFGARLVASALIILCAFLFVTVSSRIVGLVGVTSNPTSGMTIATLLLTSTVFLLLGWTDTLGKAGALSVGCVVAIAASIAGDTSQDLKTGFLLGATPKRQQTGELIGVLTSAAFVCLTVHFLGSTMGFGSAELPAPQATLMKLVIDGVLDQDLPWAFVGIGVIIALACEALKIPSLPFAVGVYLPLSTMVPVWLGGMLRHALDKVNKDRDKKDAAAANQRGVLMGSGLVGGEGLIGVVIAGAAAYAEWRGTKAFSIGTAWSGGAQYWLAAGLFALFIAGFYRYVRGPKSQP